MARQQREGAGWRVGWNPDAPEYQGLLGGEGWALELTGPEWRDFNRLVQQLGDSMAAIAPELMPEERVACDGETPLIWLEVEGFPQTYGLRFILLTGRGGEGSWPAAIVPHLLRGLGSLASA